ncbi:MAG: hypothetical protein QXH00_10125 [Candidatus Jordarchaeales archaeon]
MEVPEERPRIFPRGVPFIGFPYGLFRKFPLSVPAVEKFVVRPGDVAAITVKALKPETVYTLYFIRGETILEAVEVTTDAMGTLTYRYTVPDLGFITTLIFIPIAEGTAYGTGPLASFTSLLYFNLVTV